MFNGFKAYLQNTESPQLTFASSNESGSSVFLSGSMNGEHLVFVYPVWKFGSVISSRTMKPAYRDTYVLTIHTATTIPGERIVMFSSIYSPFILYTCRHDN